MELLHLIICKQFWINSLLLLFSSFFLCTPELQIEKISLNDLYFINFYTTNFYISLNWFFELIPEILLIFFILYGLITIFNDTQKSIYYLYRWFFGYFIIFAVLLVKCWFVGHISSQILLGFTLLNCYYTLISKLFIITLSILILLISKNKLKNKLYLNCIIEFPLVVSFSLLFMFLLTSSYDLFGVYLSIEGLSLTLYILGAMLYRGIVSIESTIKYFSLGAISSGIFLLGISIIFAIVGSLDFMEIQAFLGSSSVMSYFIEIKIAFLLLLIGILFKISAFPFHVWTADVYEGIWTPITAFFAIVVKVCLILFFIRLTFSVMFNILFIFQGILSFCSLGSMVVGALGAIKQVRIKRFIAYTSINQVGFILLGISSCNFKGLIASLMYIFLYAVMSFIFFSIILNSQHIVTKRNMIYLSDLYSFSIYNNEISKYLIITIFSMCGLPPLGGFFGKLYLYFAVIQAQLDFLIVFSLILSIISTYYYLSFIRYILFEKRSNFKLYYYIKKNLIFNLFLRVLSLVLVFFFLALPMIYKGLVKFAISCAFPFIFFSIF